VDDGQHVGEKRGRCGAKGFNPASKSRSSWPRISAIRSAATPRVHLTRGNGFGLSGSAGRTSCRLGRFVTSTRCQGPRGNVARPRLRYLNLSDLRDDGGSGSAEQVSASSGADCLGWSRPVTAQVGIEHPAEPGLRQGGRSGLRHCCFRWSCYRLTTLRTIPPVGSRLNGTDDEERQAFVESIVHKPVSTPVAHPTLISKLLRGSAVQSCTQFVALRRQPHPDFLQDPLL